MTKDYFDFKEKLYHYSTYSDNAIETIWDYYTNYNNLDFSINKIKKLWIEESENNFFDKHKDFQKAYENYKENNTDITTDMFFNAYGNYKDLLQTNNIEFLEYYGGTVMTVLIKEKEIKHD